MVSLPRGRCLQFQRRQRLRSTALFTKFVLISKDSYGLLDVLRMLQQRNGHKFELIAVNLDQKQPGFPAHVLPEYLAKVGVPFHIETQDTYSVVKEHIPEGKTM